MISFLTRLFPLWALIFAVIAYLFPPIFSSGKSAIIPLLTVVMFGMGMTLKWKHFQDVLKSPGIIFVGIMLQFIIMPLTAYLISGVFGFTAALTAGMVLVGSSPGGTASNVICYLAKGDVALSITLTMTSTLIAVIMTPLLSLLYLNKIVPVPFSEMLVSILQIVFAPVVIGTTINTLFGSKIKNIQQIFPLISTLAIVIIIAIVVALNKTRLGSVGPLLFVGVILHNLSGLVAGYWITRLLGHDSQTSRTISIEVGMQNSGLGVALAVQYFTTAAAIPGAIFSVWHNLSGSVLAGYWSGKGVEVVHQTKRAGTNPE